MLHTPKKAQRIPELLSRAEVLRLLSALSNLKHQMLLRTCYACGLRVSELVALQVRHIDTERHTLRIKQAKGAKDRNVILSHTLQEGLHEYCGLYRPNRWLFYSRHRDLALSISSAQKIFHNAKQAAGIKKDGGIHSLRHAYATHQLEAGMPIHHLQRLLGHCDLSTTLRYVHWLPHYQQPTGMDLLVEQEVRHDP